MAKKIAQAACPECSDTQSVMYDGRKYYIKCSACGTYTNYQSKAAQAQILQRVKREDDANADADQREMENAIEAEPEREAQPTDTPKTNTTPAKDTGGVFGSFDDWF